MFALQNPRWMPAFGVAAAALVWLADSLIDHYLFQPHAPFSHSLWPEAAQELWMRVLVTGLFIGLSWYARMLLRNEIRAKATLAAHQAQLQAIIADRTQELEENYRALKREMSERMAIQERLELLATTDPLTNLYNRRKFEDVLNREMERNRRYAGEFALILFDTDHFKQVNDLYGHDVGDQVLQHLADVIRAQLRKSDAVARWGGEEFIVLVAETDRESALGIAEKLRRSVETTRFPHQSTLTISLGVALARRDDTPASLIKRADQALYRAKHDGRNRVVLEAPDSPATPPA